jgi:hypothetical protein
MKYLCLTPSKILLFLEKMKMASDPIQKIPSLVEIEKGNVAVSNKKKTVGW